MQTIQKLFSIKVPTKTYLKKFIAARYGHPVRISNNTLLGVMVFNMAEKHITTRLDKNDKDLRFKFFNDLLLFKAPMYKIRVVGLGLSPDAVIQLNRFFECLFEEELYNYCQAHINQATRRKGFDKCIYEFAAKYNIDLDTDISFDALKQNEFRYRKQLDFHYQEFVKAQKMPVQQSMF